MDARTLTYLIATAHGGGAIAGVLGVCLLYNKKHR